MLIIITSRHDVLIIRYVSQYNVILGVAPILSLLCKFETRITKYTVASDEGLLPSNSKFQRSALAAAVCKLWGKVRSGASSQSR